MSRSAVGAASVSGHTKYPRAKLFAESCLGQHPWYSGPARYSTNETKVHPEACLSILLGYWRKSTRVSETRHIIRSFHQILGNFRVRSHARWAPISCVLGQLQLNVSGRQFQPRREGVWPSIGSNARKQMHLLYWAVVENVAAMHAQPRNARYR